jgi:hypothetical protein
MDRRSTPLAGIFKESFNNTKNIFLSITKLSPAFSDHVIAGVLESATLLKFVSRDAYEF